MAEPVSQKVVKVLPSLPAHQELFVTEPLYKEYRFEPEQKERIAYYAHPNVSIDCHCHECGSQSVFLPERDDPRFIAQFAVNALKRPWVYQVEFRCSRNAEHRIFFALLMAPGVFQKIGQFPSLADLAERKIREYRGILDPERFREFSKGVGLAAHGIGIGSFVYLRRIVEWLMEDTFQSALAAGELTEEAYRPVRMQEKILLLKDHLPEFMVKNRRMYNILGKGLHELTEDECRAFFDTLRLGIEVILDERMAEQRRKQKVAAAEKGLGEISQRISAAKEP